MTQVNKTLEFLRNKYRLDVIAPFSVCIGDRLHEFQCLVKGYGAKQGMIIDSDWAKLASVSEKLIELGYGFSCFEIENSDLQTFQDILDDWGKNPPAGSSLKCNA